MIHIITVLENEGRYVIPDKKELLIQDESDLENVSTQCGYCAPGSIAYTADLSIIAILDRDGIWHRI